MDQVEKFKFALTKTWDGCIPLEKSEIFIKLSSSSSEATTTTTPNNIIIEIDAPFYNDPVVPPASRIGSTSGLWDYEVVEIFFLGVNDKYLEVELAPKGHYLLLQLDGCRNITKEGLPLDKFSTEIVGDRWQGRAVIPHHYFPEKVHSINAYGIYKSGSERVYMSLFPVENGKFDSPDFHRLGYFQKIDFDALMKS